MDHLEEIRSRIGIEELVGGYVQLKKAGRNLKGLCPFHGEKTPSFIVSPDKGIAYCFGCHQGGDIFRFTQLIENVTFPEAVKILAQKAGVELPERLPKVANQRLKTIEINQWAMRFYQEKLEQNPKMKDYFLGRGLTEATIRHFGLGYAPDSYDQLKNFLRAKGYGIPELLEAAVISQRSIADQNTYDRFRNRLMFPIFDHQDNPVGMSGRIVGDGEPKYINSPETPAYNKSLILYGLNWAKESIKQQDLAIFMEGYMDVVAAHQAGTLNAVATCGTALTPQQLKLIQRYTKNIAFCFDQDQAGENATLRAIELAQMAEVEIKIIQVPEGKDPDECIQTHPAAWEKAVQNPIGVMDYYFDYALKHTDRQTLQGKKQILEFLLPLIKRIKMEMEQNIHLSRLALELKTDVKLLWNDLKNLKNQKRVSTAEPSHPNQPLKKTSFSREEYGLGFIMAYPETAKEVVQGLLDTIPIDPSTERFYKTLKNVYTAGSPMNPEALKAALTPEEWEHLKILGLLIEEEYPEFSEESASGEVRKLIREINRKNIYNVQKEYEYKIRLSTEAGEKLNLLNLYNEILKLTNKI